MAAVKTRNRMMSDQAVLRLIGRNGTVISKTDLAAGKWISASRIELLVDGDTLPEEHGRLLFLPIGDDKCSVQLFYLQHAYGENVSALIHTVSFHPGFFEQWPMDLLLQQQAFRFDQTTEQQFSICSQSQTLLEQLTGEQTPAGEFVQALKMTEQIIHLLRRAVDSLNVPFTVCPVPACRFLAHDSERDKVMQAKALLDQHLDKPITIKDLSRKVAMNECYLKKGFKALTGKTIHEYQSGQRIAKARTLLQQQGYSVSEVAMELGFSSISHFSTAFKKATGLKPCDLLR